MHETAIKINQDSMMDVQIRVSFQMRIFSNLLQFFIRRIYLRLHLKYARRLSGFRPLSETESVICCLSKPHSIRPSPAIYQTQYTKQKRRNTSNKKKERNVYVKRTREYGTNYAGSERNKTEAINYVLTLNPRVANVPFFGIEKILAR